MIWIVRNKTNISELKGHKLVFMTKHWGEPSYAKISLKTIKEYYVILRIEKELAKRKAQ